MSHKVPVDIKHWMRKPSIRGWVVLQKDGLTGYSDGFLTDVGGPPHLPDWESHRDHAKQKLIENKVRFDVVLPEIKRLELLRPVTVELLRDGSQDIRVLHLARANGASILMVDEKYVQYFVSKYGEDVRLMVSTDHRPSQAISVYLGKDRVGTIMPFQRRAVLPV